MEFYFHPIMGLQYSSHLIAPITEIDLDKLPEGMDWKEALKLYDKMGISFCNAAAKVVQPTGEIFSNF